MMVLTEWGGTGDIWIRVTGAADLCEATAAINFLGCLFVSHATHSCTGPLDWIIFCALGGSAA